MSFMIILKSSQLAGFLKSYAVEGYYCSTVYSYVRVSPSGTIGDFAIGTIGDHRTLNRIVSQ